jgi:hypothetical protein
MSARHLTVICLVLAAALYLLALRGIYEVVPVGQAISYRVNRITGATSFCTPDGCTALKEKP